MTYTPSATQTVWDVALELYGDISGIAWLLEDNPSVVTGGGVIDIQEELSVRSSTRWAYDASADGVRSLGAPIRHNAPERVGLADQNIWDIALQHYGDVNGIAWLLADNPALVAANGQVESGRVTYRLRPQEINRLVWTRMIDYFPVSGVSSASSSAWITEDGQPWITEDGQEWWTS